MKMPSKKIARLEVSMDNRDACDEGSDFFPKSVSLTPCFRLCLEDLDAD